MIKITVDNINEITDKHYNKCKTELIKILRFYIDLYRVLGLSEGIEKGQKLNEYYDLHNNTILSLISPFVIKSKRNIQTVFYILHGQDCHIKKMLRNRTNNKKMYVLLKQINLDLEKIITGKPNEIIGIYNTYMENYPLISSDFTKRIIRKIFDYSKLRGSGYDGWDAYSLTSKINVSVCPYCNSNFINTVYNKDDVKVANPQLDHFFSQKDYPLLSLSFYNLIPSCSICNTRLKGSEDMSLDHNLHPYIEEYGEHAYFEYDPQSYDEFMGLDNEDLKIELNNVNKNSEIGRKITANHEMFKIDARYRLHNDIVNEVIRKAVIFDKRYLEILRTQYTDLNLSEEEIYRIVWCNYLNEKDFNKRPLSKLTKDIVKQLRIFGD